MDTSTTTGSDSDQAEICVQYGLAYQSDQGTPLPVNTSSMEEDWQYLFNNHHDEDLITDSASISTSPVQQSPAMQESTSSSTFSRFKRNPSQLKLKKENSTSSFQSMNTTTRRKKLKSKLSRPHRRHRRQKHHRKSAGYARFQSDIMGITFLEIESAKDLPPERNMTRTGFDMDPFVIVTYGTSTFRTRAIRHNLNPTWNEKLFFHVRNSHENYKIKFAVYDKDKFTNNDFIASQEITLADIIQKVPTPPSSPGSTTTTDETETPSDEIERCMGRHTMPLNLKKSEKWQDSIHPTLTIRAKFIPYVEIRKMFWVALAKTCDADNSNTMSRIEVQTMLETLGSNISEATLNHFWSDHGKDLSEDLTMDELVESLESCMLHADEKQMLRTGYTDAAAAVTAAAVIEEGKDVPVDVKRHPTMNPFFMASEDEEGYDDDEEEDMDDDIDSDEDDDVEVDEEEDDYSTSLGEYDDEYDDDLLLNLNSATTTNPHSPDEADYEALAEADGVQYINGPLKDLELKDEDHEKHHASKPTLEKVIRLTECPICHKPNLGKRGQMDIVTHVATCAANDWTTVDRFLMGNFGTEAQAQRK